MKDNKVASMKSLQCLNNYLNPTENWIFRMLANFERTDCWLASARFLECNFFLPDAHYLRSPLQPRLTSNKRPSGWRRWARAANNLTYPWYLRAKLWHRHIDIVHCHFAPVGWHYRWLAHFTTAPLVVSFYGWDYVRLVQTEPVWLERLAQLFDAADCFLCEGPHGADLLRRQGCPEAKIRVAPLGVDVTTIPFFERTKRPGELRLAQVASFREKKGHIDTLNAFADALASRPNMHLTLIGASDGPILDVVKHVIHTRHLADKVSVESGVSPMALHSLLREYQVFIHPSKHAKDGDCEGGAPVVLLDAQATGMPVIATTHCDIPQEVIDGKTGLLCEEDDTRGLADAIIRFCDLGQAEYARRSQAARRHVEQHFDVRECAATVENIYQELLASAERIDNHVL